MVQTCNWCVRNHPLCLKWMGLDIAITYIHSQIHYSCTLDISPHKLALQGGQAGGAAAGWPAPSRCDAKGWPRHQRRGPRLWGGGQGQEQELGCWIRTLLNIIHSIITVDLSYLENVPEFCCYFNYNYWDNLAICLLWQYLGTVGTRKGFKCETFLNCAPVRLSTSYKSSLVCHEALSHPWSFQLMQETWDFR